MAVTLRSFQYRLGVPYFLSALPLASVAVLVLNDHFLKSYFGTWWTGKLSDFAGLFFTPLFLCAIVNLTRNLLSRGEFAWISRNQLLVFIFVTNLIFLLIKLYPEAAGFYTTTLRTLGFPAEVTMDPTDLVAFAASFGTYYYGRRYF